MNAKTTGIILKPLEQPEIVTYAISHFALQGTLTQANEGYLYLKIDDHFITSLFPLLNTKQKQLPPYFSDPYNIGAHISVIYQDELSTPFEVNELGSLYLFNILGLYSAQIDTNLFFILLVESNELVTIRKKYGFSDTPVYHGIAVDWHITIAKGL